MKSLKDFQLSTLAQELKRKKERMKRIPVVYRPTFYMMRLEVLACDKKRTNCWFRMERLGECHFDGGQTLHFDPKPLDNQSAMTATMQRWCGF